MKKLLLFVALLATISLQAQNSQKIIGKWAFVDLHDKSQLDEMSQQMALMIFKDLSFSFRPDGTLSLTVKTTPETGTYTFDKEDESLITATSQTGKAMLLRIISLTDSELILMLDRMGSIKMKKVSSEPDAAPPVVPTVAATEKQIVGKWYIITTEDKATSEIAAELLKDAFIEFGADGKYAAKVLSIEQNGTWEFGPENKTINVTTEDGNGVWSIYAVSDSQLIMQNDTSVKKMTFTRSKP